LQAIKIFPDKEAILLGDSYLRRTDVIHDFARKRLCLKPQKAMPQGPISIIWIVLLCMVGIGLIVGVGIGVYMKRRKTTLIPAHSRLIEED
jgi:hypothetical protein